MAILEAAQVDLHRQFRMAGQVALAVPYLALVQRNLHQVICSSSRPRGRRMQVLEERMELKAWQLSPLHHSEGTAALRQVLEDHGLE